MNVDWGSRTGPAHHDAAFPALGDVLAPPDAVGGPVVVYYYPGRTLQTVHAVQGGTLVVTDAVPWGAPPTALSAGECWDGTLRAVRRDLPRDAGLPALAEEVQAAGLLPADLGDRLLAYVPGRRAVLRLDDLILKVGEPTSTLRNHRRQHALWNASGREFAMSKPRLVDPRRGVRSEELSTGVPLLRALTGRPVQELAAELAEHIAAFHRLPPPPVPLADHGASATLRRWRNKTVRTIGRALPDLAPKAAAIVTRLADRRPEPIAPLLLHGDFHAANVLVGPAGPVLLDLDELGLGAPELDIAVMTGRLLLVATAQPEAPGAASVVRLAAALAGAYDTCADRPLRPEAFAWHLAGTLVGRQVKTSIRHLAPDLHQLADRLLDLADAALDMPPVTAQRLLADLGGVIGPMPSTEQALAR